MLIVFDVAGIIIVEYASTTKSDSKPTILLSGVSKITRRDLKKCTKLVKYLLDCALRHTGLRIDFGMPLFLAEKEIPTLRLAPYSPDLALYDLSLSHIENCSQKNPFSVNRSHP